MAFKNKRQQMAVMAALKKGDVVRTYSPIRDIGIYQRKNNKGHIVLIDKGRKKIKIISSKQPKYVRGRKQ